MVNILSGGHIIAILTLSPCSAAVWNSIFSVLRCSAWSGKDAMMGMSSTSE
jgi:hypothetical protein